MGVVRVVWRRSWRWRGRRRRRSRRSGGAEVEVGEEALRTKKDGTYLLVDEDARTTRRVHEGVQEHAEQVEWRSLLSK